MRIKEEYAVFGYKAEINSSYHYYLEKSGKSDKYCWKWLGYIPYADDNMFPSKEQALAYASEVADKSSLLSRERPTIIESDSEGYIHAAWSPANVGRYVIFVIRVPISYYIGRVWSQTLNEIGNDKYTDDKPCQVYRDAYENLRCRRLYLKREQGKADEWVKDKWEGSFFAPKEASAIADKFCQACHKDLPNSFYAWTTTELIRPAEGMEPAFEKGDEVYTLPCERWPHSICRRGRKRVVTDIKVVMGSNGAKEFAYKVTEIDGFLPQSYLLTKEQIISDGGKFYQGWFNGRREEMLDYKGATYTAY